MANAMCLIANRGWYYIPHFVKSFENETAADTVLNVYRKKIRPLAIPDSSYQAVIDGMELVVTNGTARNAKIPGYDVCAKTGTVENYYRGKKQQNHSFFVAFAPKVNPRIAVCVVVENAGYGATWAAPIASLLMEKYLTDSIAGQKRKDEIERISQVSIIPLRIRNELHIRDSLKKIRDSVARFKKVNAMKKVGNKSAGSYSVLKEELPLLLQKDFYTSTFFYIHSNRRSFWIAGQKLKSTV